MDVQTRYWLFAVCIFVRSLFVWISKTYTQYLPLFGYLALIPAVGFMFFFLTKLRETGFEAGGTIWWKNLRPFHSLLYGLFAYNAIQKNEFAWKFLLVDVVGGALFFFVHHFL